MQGRQGPDPLGFRNLVLLASWRFAYPNSIAARRGLAVVVFAFAACGGAASHPVVAPAPVAASPEEAFATPPPPPPARRADVLTRAALDATLDAGPGAFLATVKLQAVTAGGRFVGWKIVELDPRYAPAGLDVGDVVRHVNGERIDRPDDLMALWQRLRGAQSLDFDVLRGGADEVVRVPVHE